MQSPQVSSFFDQDTNTFSYVVRDPQSQVCTIIDGVLNYDAASGTTSTHGAEQIVHYVREHQLQVEWILETHAHADHLSAAVYLKEQLGGKVAIGQAIQQVQQMFSAIFNIEENLVAQPLFDYLLADEEVFYIGTLQARAMATPGHTPACMTYVIGDAAFVGDTLFMPDYGTARCDFPGGHAGQLFQSIQKIYQLPEQTRLFLCHDYLPAHRDEYQCETTVARQKAQNIHVNETTLEQEFVTMRQQRDQTLNMPKLILPAIQVNIRAGQFPSAESNGTHYLKIPLNYFKH